MTGHIGPNGVVIGKRDGKTGIRRSAGWVTPTGDPVACAEKLKVLEDNVEEFRGLALDMLEDAALMGCDVEQVRQVLREVLDALKPRYTQE